jgi:hypothetical protein
MIEMAVPDFAAASIAAHSALLNIVACYLVFHFVKNVNFKFTSI